MSNIVYKMPVVVSSRVDSADFKRQEAQGMISASEAARLD